MWWCKICGSCSHCDCSKVRWTVIDLDFYFAHGNGD